MSRYAKQSLFLGEASQEKIAKACVAIVGLGATGSVLAQWLARAGIGTLHLIDRDFVEISNLQRQLLYDESDLGQPKALAAERKIRSINSSIRIYAHVVDLIPDNAEQLLSHADVMGDGTDNFEARFLMNDVSIRHHIPWVYNGAVGSEGMIWPIHPPATPCFRCLMEQPPEQSDLDTCDTAGVLGPVTGLIGSWAAIEILKFVVGEPPQSDLVRLDQWSNERQFIHAPITRCRFCREGTTEFLDTPWQFKTSSLCGTPGVQLRVNPARNIDLHSLFSHLKPRKDSDWKLTPLFIQGKERDIAITIFKDGRMLFRGDILPETAQQWFHEVLE